MKKIETPPGMNERLLRAIEQELRLSSAELAETERYLRRFRIAPLPRETQQRVLHAVSAAPVRPYRCAYRVAIAASVLLFLPAGRLLLLSEEAPPAPVASQQPAIPSELPEQPVYIVRDADDNTEYSLRTPVVFVADHVL